MKVEGQHIWLIGASSGIGAALATRLAAQGAALALSARREDDLQEVAAACSPAAVLVKPLDTTSLEAIEAVHHELLEAWGRVDAVIYGAGAWSLAGVEEFDARAAVRQIDVNLAGLIRVAGTVMPDMIRRRSGTIAGITSVAGYAGFPRAAAYSASKAGANAFLQSIRVELKKHGVQAVTVSPGFVDTPMTRKNDFPMPFRMTSEQAAERIVAGLVAGSDEIHFPRRLSIPLKLLTALPRPVVEFLTGRLMAR